MSNGTTTGRRPVGVRIAGTGSALPKRTLTNADLEKMMATSDEWIVQRTGIRERRILNRDQGESTSQLAAESLKAALAQARLAPADLDLIIVATMTAEMSCPGSASLVANMIGAGNCGAFDLNAACSGFVYGLNVAHDLIKGGAYRNIGLIGADALSTLMQYNDAGRSTSIIFGDAAAATVINATDDTSKGILAQAMHSDGKGWKEIYVPRCSQDFPPGVEPDPSKFDHVQMNGASVFKFAVSTFPELIQQTLDKAKIAATDVDMYVCHQSNQRILHAARDRFGLAEDKLYVNIDRFGNTVAASVPLCLDELRRSGRIRDGYKVMFVAFGGGLTWGSSLWQL
ncbi:MAG: ketoacyl-ACP synthase III [Phycisphaeraceae bacterium]|nr:ketoacyl-ACP synthase III [Phycisphaeraceae bacterium]